MVTDKIKELIEPHLLFILPEEERKYIDDMCSEMYLEINEDGNEVITLKPIENGGQIAPQFSPLNGAFMGISTDWELTKQRGKRL